MALSDRFKDKITQSALEKDARYIYLKLKDILNKNDQINKKRWIWELVQNACDNARETGIDIEVELFEGEDPYLDFRHNGYSFTEDDIIDLITQSSRKTLDKKGQNSSVGMYGTGFLSTHFLSTKVQISSSLITNDKINNQFEISLDRSGDVSDILSSITNVLELVDASGNELNQNNGHSEETNFRYSLNESAIEIAKTGLKSLEKLIVNVFAFFPRLNSVNIAHNHISFRRNSTIKDGDFTIHEITRKKGQESSIIQIIHCQIEGLEGIIKLDKASKKLIGSELDEPRLYRYFPLIGSEKFYCPIIINSHDFYPNKERDGVALTTAQTDTVQQNKNLISKLPRLYSALIDYCLKHEYERTFHLVDLPGKPNLQGIDEDWYKPIIDNLHENISSSPIVRGIDNKYSKLIDDAGNINTFVPWTEEKTNRELFWNACKITGLKLVHKDDHEEWAKRGRIINQVTSINTILLWIQKQVNIEGLKKSIKTDDDIIKFLQMMIDLSEELGVIYLSRYAIIPVRSGVFKKKNKVWRNEVDQDIYDIASSQIASLEKIGKNRILYFKGLNEKVIDSRLIIDTHRHVDYSEICTKIESIRNTLLDHKNDPNYKVTLSNIFSWMLKNEELAKEHMSNLWGRRFDLKSSNEIREAFEAEKKIQSLEKLGYDIEQLLSHESPLKNADQKINDDVNSITPGFKSIVNNVIEYGRSFDRPDEFDSFLKEHSDLFTNIPRSDLDSYRKWLQLLRQAKDNIWGKLSSHERYDCSGWSTDKKYPTVITGVKKHGYDMYIVVRPSKHGMVLFHDQIEYDILDLSSSELWIYDEDNGAREYRMGKLLSQFRISKIPIV